MPTDIENPSSHDPALARDHDAGVQAQHLSPAERALAPEADAPFQSATATSDDDTYVGQAGGYMGGEAPAAETGRIQPTRDAAAGEGTYGYPHGPGVGEPGGEHLPGRHSIPAEEQSRNP
ncbi:MAG TPA: hypothetical protein VF457_14010 [Burkholderiaceae bacterium]